MKRALILIAVLCVHFCQAQDTAKSVFTKYYTVNQLKSDFVFFRATLERAHPSLYRYHSKDSVDTYFSQAEGKLDHEMNDEQYQEVLAQMIAKLGSGHTSIKLSKEYEAKWNLAQHDFLPFYVYIQDDRLFITVRLRAKDSTLRNGSEILAINNVSGAAILSHMRSVTSSDGYSNAYRDNNIAIRFHALYSLLYGDMSQFFVVLNDKGKIKHTLVKAWQTETEIPGTTKQRGSVPNNTSLPHLIYMPDLPNTAILRIPNFQYEKEYESVHAKLFKEIKTNNISNLVIDLRYNYGGLSSVCNDLMSYIMTHDYQFSLTQESCVNTSRFEYLAQKSTDGGVSLTDIEGLSRSVYKQDLSDHNVSAIRVHNFTGNLYLLVNGGSFSAATLFPTAVKSQRKCIIIGGETGGTVAGSDGGPLVDMVLPETRLRLHVPLFWTHSANSERKDYGNGLMPDIVVSAAESQSYYARGLDPVIEVVKETINQANKGTKKG